MSTTGGRQLMSIIQSAHSICGLLSVVRVETNYSEAEDQNARERPRMMYADSYDLSFSTNETKT
jgi:hydroxyacyl-ACP dehydratase HTD2-like protein with hotdog domain